MKPNSSRRDFIKSSALASLGATLASISAASRAAGQGEPTVQLSTGFGGGPSAGQTLAPARPAGQKPVHLLTTKPLDKVRVAVIGLHRGLGHVHCIGGLEFVDLVAVCDIRDDRAQAAAKAYEKAMGKRPKIYSGDESIWEQMVARDDLDAVYIATPWYWHVPMALKVMNLGKHAFIEVAAAVTVDDCWRLVDASERTQRHCTILENCCYGEQELFVLNLARQGVFGDTLLHGECGYIHDLREVLFELGSEGDWRRNYHTQVDGNLYPTHGLGPVAQRLNVGRGDQFKYLVSASSPEASLTKVRNEEQPNGGRHAAEKYVCGDMNTSIIKTELGRTIMLQHDVVSPLPYSRINALYGTDAVFFDYPPRLSLAYPQKYGLETPARDQTHGHDSWLTPKDMVTMREKFTHPLWKALAERAKGAGHDGMDFVQSYRLLDCIRKGLTPDSVVYDAAAWSSIIELSVRSVATGSMPVVIPDFTRGLWRTIPPLGIAEI